MRKPIRFVLSLLLALAPGLVRSQDASSQTPPSTERVAFLGDSITYDGRWPLRVEAALRSTPRFATADIVNFGLPSETLSGLSEPGHADGRFPRPCLHTRLTSILEKYRPTVVIAAYGMNDGIYQSADPRRLQAFIQGVDRLNEAVHQAGAQLIWITPSLYQADHPDHDIPHYDAVLDTFARSLTSHRKDGWQVIDIRDDLKKGIAALKRSDQGFIYSSDGIHPDEEGHRIIAATVTRELWPLLKLPGRAPELKDAALARLSDRAVMLKHAWLTATGYERPGIPEGLPLAEAQEKAKPLLNDYIALASEIRSEWLGFERMDFTSAGRAGLLIIPKQAAPDSPWIWRTEFFGHEPQADVALLRKGFHVAYVDVQNMWGSPEALDHMDDFYGILTRGHHLGPKPVLEGFSRGGLFALNWAARHPDQVGALYLDAPLCDFKSAPYGVKDGWKSPSDWQVLLSAYHLTEEQALAWDKNPVDNLRPLAEAHIPILSVIGDADEIVPVAENAGLLESRYKALGGEMQIIHKPGGKHHPHSLPDPTPIVDFILNATGVSH